MTANDLLLAILENHNVPVQTKLDYIEIHRSDVKLQSNVYQNAQAANGVIQLEVVIESRQNLGDRALIESFAGAGSTLDDAVHNAFDKFCRASLHVIMAVFINRSLGEEQVDWEHWERGHLCWDVCLGPLLLQGESPLEGNDGNWNYNGLLDTFREAFLQEASMETHWIRCFRGTLDDKCIGREVLLDNNPWPTGEAILDRIPFPNQPGYTSLRHFLIIIPSNHIKNK